MGEPIIIWMSSSSCLYSLLLLCDLTPCWCHSAQAKCLTGMSNRLSSTFGFCVLEFCHEMSLYLRKCWGNLQFVTWCSRFWSVCYLHMDNISWTACSTQLKIAVRANCWVFLEVTLDSLSFNCLRSRYEYLSQVYVNTMCHLLILFMLGFPCLITNFLLNFLLVGKNWRIRWELKFTLSNCMKAGCMRPKSRCKIQVKLIIDYLTLGPTHHKCRKVWGYVQAFLR